ncbi:MAG: winged helix-turn-helix transcriptional regulator [Sphingosinicella sp.]|nr:winged helix-turn-helix transcriptional regulator [Sphingosinicella sp.]
MLPTLCACSKLRRSARIISGIYDEELAPSGFSVAQFSLLRMLQKAGPSSLTALAEATGNDRTTLNRNLRPLEEAGLVRSSRGADRRARIVCITDEAKVRMRSAQPLWEKAQARIEQSLGADRQPLFTILDKIEELRR